MKGVPVCLTWRMDIIELVWTEAVYLHIMVNGWIYSVSRRSTLRAIAYARTHTHEANGYLSQDALLTLDRRFVGEGEEIVLSSKVTKKATKVPTGS